LGLAITRDLVTRYGGQISVQSKLGRGTAFTVTLPSRPNNRLKVALLALSRSRESHGDCPKRGRLRDASRAVLPHFFQRHPEVCVEPLPECRREIQAWTQIPGWMPNMVMGGRT